MADTLVIYYSLEGNSAFVAEEISERTGAVIEQLVVDKEPPKKGFGKILVGGRSAIFKEDPGLHLVKENVDDYYRIILVFPVWAGTFPPAIGAFLDTNQIRGKDVYIIACSGSGDGDKAIRNAIKKLPGNRILGTLNLQSPLDHQEDAKEKIKALLG